MPLTHRECQTECEIILLLICKHIAIREYLKYVGMKIHTFFYYYTLLIADFNQVKLDVPCSFKRLKTN